MGFCQGLASLFIFERPGDVSRRDHYNKRHGRQRPKMGERGRGGGYRQSAAAQLGTWEIGYMPPNLTPTPLTSRALLGKQQDFGRFVKNCRHRPGEVEIPAMFTPKRRTMLSTVAGNRFILYVRNRSRGYRPSLPVGELRPVPSALGLAGRDLDGPIWTDRMGLQFCRTNRRPG